MFLAYHLMRWIEHSLELSGHHCTWRTLRRRLQTHCYATVIIPTSAVQTTPTKKPAIYGIHFLIVLIHLLRSAIATTKLQIYLNIHTNILRLSRHRLVE